MVTHERARNGTLAIVGGRIVVEPAEPGGRDPEIDWEDGVFVLIDGLPPRSRPCPVLYGQSVEALAPDEKPRVELFAELSRDEMAATLSVERHPGGRFRLEDQPANRELVVRRLLVERIPCAPPAGDVADTFLYERGIVHGIRQDAIARCLTGAVLAEQIAWGTRPIEPEDGELTIASQLGPAQGGGLWSVPTGSVLATVRLPVEGVPGWTVRGEIVPVRPARTVDLELGAHVTRSVDNRRIVSAIDGFPRIENGRIEVSSVARLERDLDDRAGDIHAHGSLELHGSVAEGRQLRVRGDLLVTGGVEHAEIEVGGSAEIRGVVSASRLQIGGMRAPAVHLLSLIDGIPAELARAHSLIEQLVGAAAGKGQTLAREQAASLVVSRYFADAARTLKHAAAYAAEQSDALGLECAGSLRDSVTVLMAVESGSAPENGLAEATQTIALRVSALRESLSRPVSLVASVLQASRLELGGDLEIVGRGVVGCELHVLGNVSIEQAGASLRGGSLALGGTALIAELGSVGEAITVVRLGPRARLVAGIVHPGVSIEPHGDEPVSFVSLERHVEISGLPLAA
ncbi:MAG: flagellar assembly protein A [Gaiellales bacterium]